MCPSGRIRPLAKNPRCDLQLVDAPPLWKPCSATANLPWSPAVEGAHASYRDKLAAPSVAQRHRCSRLVADAQGCFGTRRACSPGASQSPPGGLADAEVKKQARATKAPTEPAPVQARANSRMAGLQGRCRTNLKARGKGKR